MAEDKAMYEKFQMLLNTEKRIVVSQLGTPAFSLGSFVVYNKNDLWMVLYFREERNGYQLHSLLKAVCFFDADLKHLWSTGIHLVSNSTTEPKQPDTVDKLIKAYGKPHAEIGGGKSAFVYLTDDGYIIFAKYQENAVLEISKASLNELAKVFK
ncbi:MAG: hypothetical protein ACI37Z_01750 [Candidatus Gastranaerophilaceae bacterium]